jgi:hypothetical protein
MTQISRHILIMASVPQGSVLGPVLYLIHTSDIPQPEEQLWRLLLMTTAIMTAGGDEQDATNKLQRAADEVSN